MDEECMKLNSVEKLLRLYEENPGLKVLTMVNRELSMDYLSSLNYWEGSMGEVELDEVFEMGERIYFRTVDECELEDKISENLGANNPSWSDSYLDEKVEEEMKLVEWEKVIVLKIELP